MTLLTLQIIWFVLAGVVIAGYALLGGYDLGVGCLYLFQRSQKDRYKMMRTIGPYWGANQIWLVTAGGGLFAAFPFVFATVFSGFYLAMILVLVGLILRTIALEFRHQLDNRTWNNVWDLCFGIGSLLPSFLLGVAVGNIVRGIPLEADAAYSGALNFAGSFFDLLNPYALLMGFLSLAVFVWHGANYLIAVDDGSVRRTANTWSKSAWRSVVILYFALTAWTFILSPHLIYNFTNAPALFLLPFLALAGVSLHPSFARKNSTWGPLLASTLAILGMVGTVGASLFPRLVLNLNSVTQYQPAFFGDFSSPHLQDSLTLLNASSSQLTLTVMTVVAAIGVPLVLIYTIFVYAKMGRDKGAPEPEAPVVVEKAKKPKKAKKAGKPA